MPNDNRGGQDMRENQDEKSKGGGNPGNFANDPERAREAGRKGGQQSGGGQS